MRIFEQLNSEASEMQGNALLDPMEFEFIRGEFNGPYPADFQGLAKQNLGNGFDQVFLAQWNKARREGLEARLALEVARLDVRVKQAHIDWTSASFLLRILDDIRLNIDSTDFDEYWTWTKRHMETSAWQSQCQDQLRRLTGRSDLDISMALNEAPLPLIRSALESEVTEDFSLLELKSNARRSIDKWESRYALSQKLPDFWFGYYQLTIEDTYGYDGILIQLDIPWTSWFERSIEPVAEIPIDSKDPETFERDQRKVALIEQFERFEGEYLLAAPELLNRARSSEDIAKKWSYWTDYTVLISEYNKALIEWQFILQL